VGGDYRFWTAATEKKAMSKVTELTLNTATFLVTKLGKDDEDIAKNILIAACEDEECEDDACLEIGLVFEEHAELVANLALAIENLAEAELVLGNKNDSATQVIGGDGDNSDDLTAYAAKKAADAALVTARAPGVCTTPTVCDGTHSGHYADKTAKDTAVDTARNDVDEAKEALAEALTAVGEFRAELTAAREELRNAIIAAIAKGVDGVIEGSGYTSIVTLTKVGSATSAKLILEAMDDFVEEDAHELEITAGITISKEFGKKNNAFADMATVKNTNRPVFTLAELEAAD